VVSPGGFLQAKSERVIASMQMIDKSLFFMTGFLKDSKD